MYIFFKAEIATSSLDLRSADDMYDKDAEGNYVYKYPENSIVPQYTDEDGKTKMGYSKEDYDENDYSDDTVCGTVRIQRVTYNGETTGTNTGKVSNLTYISVAEFTKMIENKQSEVLDYFTIDGEHNLIVAGWSNSTIEYTFSGLNEYNEDEKEQIKSEYQNEEKYNVYKYRSIPYQDYISKYTMSFEFLMTLLETTDDEDFCKELAKISETSYVVITLHEEYSTTTTTVTTNHEDYEIIYATLDAKCSGTSSSQITEQGSIDIPEGVTSEQLKTDYRWNEGYDKSQDGNAHGNSWYVVWKWTYTENDDEEITYELKETNNGIQYFNYTKKNKEESVNTQTVEDLFITKSRNFVKNGYPLDEVRNLPAISEDEGSLSNSHLDALTEYTKKITKSYEIIETKKVDSNAYKIEVTEINNWYEYYKKTYSETITEDIGNEPSDYEEEAEITEDNKGTRQIVETDEINEIDYIKEISENTKIALIKQEIGKNDLTDVNLEILQVKENFYKYGIKKIHTESSGTKWKKGEKATEEVLIKVQKNNEIAFLTISADEITSNDQIEAEGSDSANKEIIYGTTDKFTDGFLNVYDKYEEAQKALNSIEEWTFKMLDSSATTVNTTNLLKYLLFLYDGTDLGVTEYDLNLFRPTDFNSVKIRGSALVEWLRSYEFNDLREFRNGNKTKEQYLIDKGYIRYNEEGDLEYSITYLSVDNTLDLSYGLNLCKIDPNTYEYTLTGGEWSYYKAFLEEEGYDIYALIDEYIATARANGGISKGASWIDADIIDKMQIKNVNDTRQDIKEEYEAAGIILETHELDALTAISYAYGNIGFSANREAVAQYKDGTITKEELMDRFIVQGVKVFYPGASRGEQLTLMFFDGTYQLFTGEIIDPNTYSGGTLVDWEGNVYVNDLYTFPVYNQYDERWGSLPFGGPNGRPAATGGEQKTISSSGCGCCSLAVILSGYLDELITPDLLTETLDDVYPSGSYYHTNLGSSHTYLTTNDVVGKYGCSAKAVNTREEALEALKNGYAVIGSEEGHILAFVPVSSEDAANGYVFRIIDSARGHNVLCRNFSDADNVVNGNAGVIGIIYPPEY